MNSLKRIGSISKGRYGYKAFSIKFLNSASGNTFIKIAFTIQSRNDPKIIISENTSYL